MPVSDAVRVTRRTVFGPSADELALEGGTQQEGANVGESGAAEAGGGGGGMVMVSSLCMT